MMPKLSRLPLLVISALVVFIPSLSGCGSGRSSGDKSGDSKTSAQALDLSAPAYVVQGTSFDIRVTAKTSSGSTATGATGTVSLSADKGTVLPQTVSLIEGRGQASIWIAGVFGEVKITAALGQSMGEATIATVALPGLPGAASSPAAAAIPVFSYAPDAAGFATNHPGVPGLPLSFNQVLVSLEPDASVADVNGALAAVSGTIVGGVPAAPGGHGVLVVRLPATDHSSSIPMQAALNASPAISTAVSDVMLGTTTVTQPNAGDPVDWSWETVASGTNWGLELIRVPAMWNANDMVMKAGGPTLRTGVIDAGFRTDHPDLGFAVLESAVANSHGTHVAGTIGARVGNGIGVDGVNPFARLHAIATTPVFPAATALQTAASLGASLINNVYSIATSGTPVANMSLGYNWGQPAININPPFSLGAPALVNAHALIVADMLNDMPAAGIARPLLVVAAGNDSDDFSDDIHAQYGSPMAYAGLTGLTPDILVVEAIMLTAGGGLPTRPDFSNRYGNLSAPGVAIWSTSTPLLYESQQGTSMAAPHVTGVLSYLLAVAPSLTNAELKAIALRDRILADAVSTEVIDAYSCLLNIDWAVGSDTVLRALLDIDDGTADGNQRIDAASADFVNEDVDGDGGRGDGAIDMSDFRRFRDWLLQAEDDDALLLNGSAQHIKKDLNRDGVVGTANEENVHPRGDFNGDGVIDRDLQTYVSGLFDTNMTDLEMLESRFVDPHYTPASLHGLLDSGDVVIDAGQCMQGLSTVHYARSTVKLASDQSLVEYREHDVNGTGDTTEKQIYTLPPDHYRLEFAAYNIHDELLVESDVESLLLLGDDESWTPLCAPEIPQLVIQLDEWTDAYASPVPLDLAFTANYVWLDGSEVAAVNAVYTISVDGGTTANPVGVLGSGGSLATTVLPDNGAETVAVTIDLVGASDVTAQLVVYADRIAGHVVLTRNESVVIASAGGLFGGSECRDESSFRAEEMDFSDINESHSAQCDLTEIGCGTLTASGFASLALTYTHDPADGRLTSIRAVGAGSGVGEFNNPNNCQGGWGGGGYVGVALRLDVIEETVHMRVTGSSFVGGLSVSIEVGDVLWLDEDPGSFLIEDSLDPGSYELRIFHFGRQPAVSYDVLVEFSQEQE